jgi:hypothetical protein
MERKPSSGYPARIHVRIQRISEIASAGNAAIIAAYKGVIAST